MSHISEQINPYFEPIAVVGMALLAGYTPYFKGASRVGLVGTAALAISPPHL